MGRRLEQFTGGVDTALVNMRRVSMAAFMVDMCVDVYTHSRRFLQSKSLAITALSTLEVLQDKIPNQNIVDLISILATITRGQALHKLRMYAKTMERSSPIIDAYHAFFSCTKLTER